MSEYLSEIFVKDLILLYQTFGIQSNKNPKNIKLGICRIIIRLLLFFSIFERDNLKGLIEDESYMPFIL